MKKNLLPVMTLLFGLLGLVLVMIIGRVQIGHFLTDNVFLTPTPPPVVIRRFYVPVSGYQEYRQGLTLTELAAAKLCALQGTEADLQQLFPQKADISYVVETDVITALREDYICLLPPDKVSYQYKTLSVNNLNFWAKETDLLTAYPLGVSETVTDTPATRTLRDASLQYTDNALHTRVFVSGEIIPARAVDRLALNKNNNYTYMFDYFRQDIESADLAIALLENDLKGDPTPCTGCMSFVGDLKNVAGFKTVGFDMMSLAGNHAGDGEQSGFKSTIEEFDKQGLLHAGTGKSDTEKMAPAIMEINGRRIGMIAADTVSAYYYNAGTSYYGTNYFSKASNSNIDWPRVRSVAQIKADNNIDYLIAYMSWGIEYTNKATAFQTELAHGLIDNGVDLIVASHPHWTQNIEWYKGKPIFYAIGNFIFDQNHTDPTREGVNLNLYYFNSELKAIDIQPHLACGPYITNNNLTSKYLAGEIDMNYLNTHDEKQGCVYFQPRRLSSDNFRYHEVYDRMLQYSDIIK